MREIWFSFKDWLIHKFDTHCDTCRHNELENDVCANCEYLKIQLEHERNEREKLQSYILALHNQPVGNVADVSDEELLPINRTKYEPWHVRRARLEADDKVKLRDAKLQHEMEKLKKIPTKDLERELLHGEPNANAG